MKQKKNEENVPARCFMHELMGVFSRLMRLNVSNACTFDGWNFLLSAVSNVFPKSESVNTKSK